MALACVRCLFVAGCLSAVIQAAPFTLVITSTNSPVGSLPSGPLAGTASLQTIDLTPNVQATYVLSNYTNNFYPGGGPPHTGATATVVQTVTVNGVSVNITRTLTLIPAASPGHDCANVIFSPAVTVTVDLGASGKVDVTLPLIGDAGEDCNNGTVLSRGIVVIPGVLGSLLLHDVPIPGIPLPPTLILSLTGLASAGLYHVRRKYVRSNETERSPRHSFQ
jgi:hypothetical protein